MWRGYERKLKPRKRELPPYASINSRYEIVLNACAHQMLDGANYVELYYDPARRRIGIKWPTRGDYRNQIFTARGYGRRRRMRIIRAKRLLRKFGVEITATLVFRNLTSEPGPMLVLDLTTAEPLARQTD